MNLDPKNRTGKKFVPEVIQPDLFSRMVENLPKTGSFRILKLFALNLVRFTGLRVNELLSLVPSDLAGGVLTVRQGKGSKTARIGLNQALEPLLTAWMEERERLGIPPTAPMICNLRGEPMSAESWNKGLKALAAKAGYTGNISNHSFRHSLAIAMNNKGLPLTTISKVLRHERYETTSKYLAQINPKVAIDTMKSFSF